MTIQSVKLIYLKNETKLNDRSLLSQLDLITQNPDQPSSIKS